MYTKELVQKAKQAQSPEELVELSKGTDDELTLEQAQEAFAKLQACGELSDDELDNVAGGCGGRPRNFSMTSQVPICPLDTNTLRLLEKLPEKGYDLYFCRTCERCYRNYYDGEWTLD